MIYRFIKPFLFRLDPEDAHHATLQLASLSPLLGKMTGVSADDRLAVKVGSKRWGFPLGLAAGVDKNAEALKFFENQGFGAIECGTVTLRPQNGNPRPRMFRYPSEESLRNAMGFPNKGVSEIIHNLRTYQGKIPLGVNFGKNKDTSPEASIDELSLLLTAISSNADYFVVNVSSPNTPGLRALQEKSYLTELITELNKVRNGKDLYLKIAPDLSVEKIRELVGMTSELKLSGIIATNTTIMPERGAGGVSGRLLAEKSVHIRSTILALDPEFELIAVGGISEPKDLFDLWRAGGKAAQVYTAYVYQGPELLKKFHQALVHFVTIQGLSLEEFFTLPKEDRLYRLKSF
jgi:dihydroorotate dehydrogenase